MLDIGVHVSEVDSRWPFLPPDPTSSTRTPAPTRRTRWTCTAATAAAGLGRSPSAAEIGRSAGLGEQQVRDALQAGNSFRPMSLDDVDDFADSWAQRRFAQPCVELQSAEDREQVGALLRRLPEREQRIVRLRFGQDLTQHQIAERIGVSQMQVSRLLNRSLKALRTLAG
jgi:RNA polymerase sigma-B factor